MFPLYIFVLFNCIIEVPEGNSVWYRKPLKLWGIIFGYIRMIYFWTEWFEVYSYTLLDSNLSCIWCEIGQRVWNFFIVRTIIPNAECKIRATLITLQKLSSIFLCFVFPILWICWTISKLPDVYFKIKCESWILKFTGLLGPSFLTCFT